MRTSSFAGLLALAASSTAQYLNETAEFALVVLSSNATYNGTTLQACHEGAAVEGLCGLYFSSALNIVITNNLSVGPTLGSSEVQTFHQNYSASLPVNATIGTLGYLVFNLPIGTENGTELVQSPMYMSYNLASNVAAPYFEPGYNGLEVAFADDNIMTIPTSVDDTTYPPTYQEVVLDKWYICATNLGYAYTTLAWTMGPGVPQNPTCVKASVKRVFMDATY
jgi:hypothetical protein